MKRILSFILTVLLCISFLPAQGFADLEEAVEPIAEEQTEAPPAPETSEEIEEEEQADEDIREDAEPSDEQEEAPEGSVFSRLSHICCSATSEAEPEAVLPLLHRHRSLRSLW